MKMKTLYNPSQSPITNYPISEAEFDFEGKIKKDSTGKYIETGNTLLWNLAPGETAQFPEYVADYLKSIYDFLVVKEDEVPVPVDPIPDSSNVTVTPDTKPEVIGKAVCRHCGQSFKDNRGLGLHIAVRHPEAL